jgi:hypothetical protein
VESGTEGRGPRRRPGPKGAWTDELGEAFLALLRQTGNFSASSRALGHPNLFNNRRRWDRAFRRACEAAVEEADARLSEADSPFLPPIEVKSDPSGEPPGDPGETPLDPGDRLKPGGKRRSAQPQAGRGTRSNRVHPFALSLSKGLCPPSRRGRKWASTGSARTETGLPEL